MSDLHGRSPLIFDSPLGRIVFNRQALDVFDRHRQGCASSREAGGQLFFRPRSDHIEVVSATQLSGGAARGRYFFAPRRDHERAEIAQLYSQGLHYVGDWHTHPEDQPQPSAADLQKITDIFRRSEHELAAMLLVVVGRLPFPAGLWCGLVNAQTTLELAPLVQDVAR